MATKIEWVQNKNADGSITQGRTWNPTVGCKEKSRGCLNCYAAKMAWRIIHMNTPASKAYEGTVKKLSNGKIVWTGIVNLLQQRLIEPLENKTPTTYFVDSMSDLFHKDVPFNFIDMVIAVMVLCPQHTFQVLTKRDQRMLEYFESRQDMDYVDEAAEIIACEHPHLFYEVEKLTGEARKRIGKIMITNKISKHLVDAGWFTDTFVDECGKDCRLSYEGAWPAKNIWLGVSIEDQKAANERRNALYKIHQLGWITWVSNEPATGSVNWQIADYSFINWMVTGGESGTAAVPVHPSHVRGTRDYCNALNIPFFFKQWGQWLPADQNDASKPIPAGAVAQDIKIEGMAPIKMYKLSKAHSGRQLDGKYHNEVIDRQI